MHRVSRSLEFLIRPHIKLLHSTRDGCIALNRLVVLRWCTRTNQLDLPPGQQGFEQRSFIDWITRPFSTYEPMEIIDKNYDFSL